MKKNFLHLHIFILLTLIISFGFFLRLYLILTRNIFTDEVFYFEVAKNSNLSQIILIKHWIKDHGILYYLFIKPFIFFTTDIIYLRLTNLIFYIIVSLVIFLFFHLFNFGYWSLLPVLFYSINRYFVYISSWISPFNLVSFFAIISLLSLSFFVFKQDYLRYRKISYFIFIISTILGFYSDYSFFYMFFFYFFIFLYVLLKNKRLLLYLIVAYQAVLAFVLPGIFQFYNNLAQIVFLFRNHLYKESNLLIFFSNITQTLILRNNFIISLLYFFGLVITINLIKKNINDDLKTLAVVLFASLFINIILMFFVVNHLISIYVERSFWFFNFILVILISIITFLLKQQKKILLSTFFLIIFLVFSVANYFSYKALIGEIYEEYNFNNLIKSLSVIKNYPDRIILVDKLYYFYPLKNYFLSTIYSKSGKYYKEILNLKKNLKNIQRVKFLSDIDESEFKKYRQTVLVLFHPDETEINYARYLKEKYENLIIYTTRKLNAYEEDFIIL